MNLLMKRWSPMTTVGSMADDGIRNPSTAVARTTIATARLSTNAVTMPITLVRAPAGSAARTVGYARIAAAIQTASGRTSSQTESVQATKAAANAAIHASIR